MTYQEVIGYFGKAIEVARQLEVTPQAVSIWKDKGIPYIRQCHIEVFTEGQLRAERTESHSCN